MSKNLSKLLGRKGVADSLFDKFGKLNAENNSLAQDQLDHLANEFLIGSANTYGSVTFYDFLKEDNKNKKVYVCNGTACECSGSQEKVNSQLLKHFSAEQIGHMCCLGRCHENGAFHFNGNNFSAKSDAEISDIISGKELKGDDHFFVNNTGACVLTGKELTIDAFKAGLEKIIKNGSKSTIEEIKTSNLRGRGGAGFPMGFKLESCKNVDDDLKFIICNADEGDPGAYSDRYLLEKQPLLVLFGMMVSGFVTGSEWGLLYIRAEYPDSVFVIDKYIQLLSKEGLLGNEILGSSFNFNFKIIKAQGAYICGEETSFTKPNLSHPSHAPLTPLSHPFEANFAAGLRMSQCLRMSSCACPSARVDLAFFFGGLARRGIDSLSSSSSTSSPSSSSSSK